MSSDEAIKNCHYPEGVVAPPKKIQVRAKQKFNYKLQENCFEMVKIIRFSLKTL